jgi:hypothetical protein
MHVQYTIACAETGETRYDIRYPGNIGPKQGASSFPLLFLDELPSRVSLIEGETTELFPSLS